MTDREAKIRSDLLRISEVITRVTRQLAELEGHRDRLLRELLDSEGLHDRQPAGVR